MTQEEDLSASPNARTIAEDFKQTREKLAADYRAKRESARYLAEHTAALDRTVSALARCAGLPQKDLVLVAVGGYGRAELYPFSDIDVLVLTTPELGQSEEAGERISGFLNSLWNLGLSVGASVRDTESFVSEGIRDVSVSTTYLEHRVLFGDEALFEKTWETFRAGFDPRAFFRDKMLELKRRHLKHEDSPFALEPNIKESPGALRDLQVFLWCARAAGIAGSVKEMAENGLITENEMHALTRSAQFLEQLRVELHLLANRHEDRLIFDVQEELAARMGYRATALMRASEALMKRYYLNAKTVVQMSVIQLQAISDRLFGGMEHARPVRLERDFLARGEDMDLADPDLYRRDPGAILRTFLVYGRHPELKRLSTRLLRALWHETPKIGEAFRHDPANHRTFLEILWMPKGTYHALKLLNTWDVLGRFLPAWRHIVGEMQHDLYHIFTVDQHTLRTVRNIRRFARSEFAHEYPYCSEVMAELPNHWRLVLAALFHDIGKGLGGQHALVGEEKVRDFARVFGLSAEDTDFVAFLVREHLTLSQTAQKRDISSPEVVAQFARLVGTKERLDALYLLTVADIRATSPRVWTRWKAQLLETLHRTTRSRLAGGDSAATVQLALEKRRKTAESLLEGKVTPEARNELWNQCELVYFMRHSAQELAWHAEMIAGRVSNPEPLVRARISKPLGGVVILFYLPDRVGLFQRAVGVMGKFGLSVVDARVYTTRHGFALDTFLVADQNERLTRPEQLKRFEETLAKTLVGELPTPRPPKGRLSRRSRHFPTRQSVSILPDDSGRASILSIVCTDRIGLLYEIAAVLSRYELNLQTAKIATLGERVEDVFLIDGPALQSDDEVLALEADLVVTLQPPKA